MQQLEAYLGGELPSEESGVTWREERDILTTRIRVGGCRDCMYARKTSTVHSQRCSCTYACFFLLTFTLALGCDVIMILFLLYSVSGLLKYQPHIICKSIL